MAVDRRDFIRRGAALTAAGLTVEMAGCGGASPAQSPQSAPATPAPAANSTEPVVQFDFTGLFAFEYWEKNDKKACFVLPTPQNVGPHAPILVMPWDNVDHARVGGANYVIPPQPIRLGKETLALWTLADTRVWVADYNKNGYDTDDQSELTFKRDATYESGKPSKPGSEAEWEYLYWFADLRSVVRPTKPKDPLRIPDRNKLASEILLTRGAAVGRVPKRDCEKTKTYSFVYSLNDLTDPRVYATQVLVTHPVPNGKEELELKFSNWKKECDARSLFVKAKKGETVPISIMNAPLAHPVKMTHFTVFYGIVDAPKKPALKVIDNECGVLVEPSCKLTDKKRADMKMGGLAVDAGPASPYDGCIPPGIPQDPLP